jgi:tRNA G18 (ribose-2'-O)-methylase SpoU
MPLIPLSSIDDPRLAPFRQLKRTNATRWLDQFVAEGHKLVERLFENRFEVVSVLSNQRSVEKVRPVVPDDVPLLVLPDDEVSRLVGYQFHYGVLACARRRASANLADLCQDVRSRSERRRYARLTLVVLPDVQDPDNLGSILRTSAALGIDGVLLGERCGDPFSRRVLRVSMGASLSLPLVESRDLDRDLAELHSDWGVELWATVLDPTAEPLASVVRPPKLALLLGGEGHGLEPRWIERCERRVTIPMSPRVDSLNVAVAAGIFLHELMKDA